MNLPVVDENDVEIGIKDRDQLTSEDIYRVSALWISNSKGEHLIAKRALSKKKNPGRWGPSVAGTVEEGETYESNMLKEIQEELGITLQLEDLHQGPKILKNSQNDRYYTQWYFAKVDRELSEFTYPESEVMNLRWITTQEIQDILKEHPEEFISSTPAWIDSILAESAKHAA